MMVFYILIVLGIVYSYISIRSHFEDKKNKEAEKNKNVTSLKKKKKLKVESNVNPKPHKKRTYKNETQSNPLKTKGDLYERFIGKQLEDKGDLVIYNGLIRGYEDRGVDIISISSSSRVINLIQCKNWTKMKMKLSDIETIYKKLETYTSDLEELQEKDINSFLHYKKDKSEIANIIKNTKYYKLRKTLYASSQNVVDLEVGKHLKLMNSNIFKYLEMKIVFVDMT